MNREEESLQEKAETYKYIYILSFLGAIAVALMSGPNAGIGLCEILASIFFFVSVYFFNLWGDIVRK